VDLILNWLWQGVVVALAAEAALAVIPRSRTHARYCFVATACALVLALPAVPYVAIAASFVATLDSLSPALGPVVSMPAAWWTSTPLVVCLWIVWSVVCGARLGAAAIALRAAKARCRACPDDMEVRLHHWSRVKASGRRARLALSTHVRAAAVLGCGSPTIALSPVVVARFDDADLDRIVIHEWAHVQRRDDIAQVVQRLVRIVAGWHPAVWWLERRLELEREVACDDMAVALTGSAKRYATCLATLAALPCGPMRSLPAVAMSSSAVERRVLRILASRRTVSARRSRAITACASGALAILAMLVGNVEIAQSTAVAPPPAATAAPDTVATSPAAASVAAAPAASASRPASPHRLSAPENGVRSAPRAANPVRADIPTTLPTTVEPPAPVRADRAAMADTRTPPQTPLSSRVEAPWTASIPGTPPSSDAKPRSPWTAAADGGVAIGRRSQTAGVATAGFFSRFGKRIADSF
jgi:beta-lactamase regulating signal transducer with metallopeptidase domain